MVEVLSEISGFYRFVDKNVLRLVIVADQELLDELKCLLSDLHGKVFKLV